MARALRIQYPGAWYHIMNRGACRKPIFNNNAERILFLKVLSETTLSHQIEIHAYCLMGNHYHLLIHTPKGNLAEAMHQLGSVYTIRYNKIHGTDGPLFRGRYKSILVDSENYLIHLSRYIHLNPIKPGFAENPEDYVWSSYQAYLGITPNPPWLFTHVIKQYFLKETWPFEYIEFTNAGNSDAIDEFYKKARTPSILGSDNFIETIKQNHSYLDYSNEVSDKVILRPTIANIVDVTSYVYEVPSSKVYCSLRGIENTPRLMVMLIAKKYFGYKLSEILQAMSMHSQKTVASNIARLEKLMAIDSSLVDTRDRILNLLH